MEKQLKFAKVLLVDDSETDSLFISKILIAEGYVVSTAQNASQGVEKLKTEEFDLFLLDVLMPGTSGFELCQQIRSIPAYKETPVIFLTALSDPENIKKGFELGGNDYITKPFDKNILKIRVYNQLQVKKAHEVLKEKAQFNFKRYKETNQILRQEIKERIRTENKFKVSEEKYRSIFSNSPIGIFHSSPAGKFIEVNPALAKMLGYETPQQVVENIKDIAREVYVHTSKRSGIVSETLHSGQIEHFENLYKKRDGTHFYANLYLRKIYDNENNVKLLEGFVEDVTYRKNFEQRLRENKKRFQVLYENAPICYQSLNSSGKILDVNPHWCETLKYQPAEVVGKQFADLLSPESKADFVDYFKFLKKTGFVQNFRLQIKRSDSKVLLVSFNVRVSYDNQGNFAQTHCVFRDITKEALILDTLKQSRRRYKTLFDQSNDAILLHNLKGQIINANPKSSQMTGYSYQKLLSCELEQLQPPSIKKQTQAHNEQLRKQGTLRFESQLITAAGEKRIIEVSSSIIDRQAELVQSTIRDITQSKKAQKRLKESEQKLKKAVASKDKFFSIIAHDLKNPFQHILGFTELILKHLDAYPPEKTRQMLGMVHDSAQQTYELLQTLLQWARSQSGRIPFEPENILVNEICKENVKFLQGAAQEKNIALKAEICEQAQAYADANMIQTVLRNLITNAIKFTPENGNITVATRTQNDFVHVVVTDSGVGIPPDELKKLFKIDQSFSTPGTAGEKGTGLGLILCKEFVERNGGTIHAESTPGKGSRFIFSLRQSTQESKQ